MSVRKAISKPAAITSTEDLERRLAMLEDRARRMPVRQITPATTASTLMISQTAHGLAVEDVIRHNGSSWTKAQADTAANAVVGGIVIAVLSPDVFVMATAGYVSGLSGLTAGSVYYLDASTAGAITLTPPTISVQVLLADTASSGVLMSRAQASSALAYGISLPTSILVNVSASTTSSTTAPADGIVYAWAVGGGGGGGRSGNLITSYVAASSGGAVTTAFYSATTGGGGGGGGQAFGAIAVTNGATISYTCGAGGAAGSSAGDAGSNGTASTVTIGAYGINAAFGYGGGGTSLRGRGGRGGYGAGSGQADHTIKILSDGQPGQSGETGSFVSGTTMRGGLGGGLSTGSGGNGENYVTGTGGSGNQSAGTDGQVIIGFAPAT